MRWYFALNAASIHTDQMYAQCVEAAVLSAVEKTSLEPHFIFDGPDCALTQRVRQLGGKVIFHRTSLYDDIIAARPSDPGWQQIAHGAYLRLDIPVLDQESEFVLYTDCDVLFLRDPALVHLRPRLFAVAPEFTRGDYEHMNSGVMVMNLAGMRSVSAGLRAFVVAGLADFPAFDQGALRAFFQGQYEPLPETLNWKPYWGSNPRAEIIHFHGPKPPQVKEIQSGGRLPHSSIVELYERVPDYYAQVVLLWDSYVDRASKNPDVWCKFMSISYEDRGTPSDDPMFNSRDPAFAGAVLDEIMSLNNAIAATGEPIEGNVCYWDQTPIMAITQNPPTRDWGHVGKRINLSVIAQRHSSALEIGLNGGHSALICLLSNPNLHFFSVDLCFHQYTKLAATYLKNRFGRRFHFFPGDSREVLPRMAVEHPRKTFDLLHVDGGHGADLAYTDISNCLRMASRDAELIFDDVNAPHLNEVLEDFIRNGYLSPLHSTTGLVGTPLHEILKVDYSGAARFA